LVEAGDNGGHGPVVGGETGGEGQEPFRVKPGCVLKVDAVDSEEVRINIAAVLADPSNID
jgi:hypothetical protein